MKAISQEAKSALIEALNWIEFHWDEGFDDAISFACEIVESFPTSDACNQSACATWIPTETTAPRLIDANELKKIIESYGPMKWWPYAYGFEDCIEVVMNGIDEMPTVETTDDVIDSVASVKFEKLVTNSKPFTTMGFYASKWYEIGYWKTPLEAVTRLEAALRA